MYRLPTPPALAHVAPEPPQPPISPRQLVLPPIQGQGVAGGSGALLSLPPPPGLAHVAREPSPPPIFPRPLPSLPTYKAQGVPSGPGSLLSLDTSLQLKEEKNRLGPLWDYPIPEYVSPQELMRRQAARHMAYQDQQLIQPTAQNLWYIDQSAVPHRLAINNLLNPAPGAPTHAASQVPHESSSAATPRPQEAVNSNDPSSTAAPPTSSTSTTPPSHDALRSGSEPVPHLDSHDVSPRLPRRLSLPLPDPSADLSTFPAQIAQTLRYSAQLSLSTACASASADGPQYELVEEDYVPRQQTPVSEKINGPFVSRHTANVEAAKMFVHRFWVEVMDRGERYRVHIGEAGILTLGISYEDGRGKRMETSVFVRRKGSPERRDEAQAVDDAQAVDEAKEVEGVTAP